MTMVLLRNSQRRIRLDGRRLRRRAQRLLEALSRGDELLSILLTDDRGMARLHGRWMGDPSPTDVLSFPYAQRGLRGSLAGHPCRGGPVPVLKSPPGVLGDVAISVETAARRRPRGAQAETERYLIHGLLHLAGYGHARGWDRRRMDRKARRLRDVLEGRGGKIEGI